MSRKQAQIDREHGLQTTREDLRILIIHLKQSIKYRFHRKPKGAKGYDEAAELANFSRECTHQHGFNEQNQHRSVVELEQKSELSTSLESRKAVRVSASLLVKSLPPIEQQLKTLMKRWIDPNDDAVPGQDFEDACPVTSKHLSLIKQGEYLNDGVNDWVTRVAALKGLDDERMAMREASSTDEAGKYDLRALNVLYAIVEGLEVYGWAPWEVTEWVRW
ncbi:hypothetical protein P7C71_g3280, partial [Lecanoromycetidae sp. Uapishka_2]